MNALLILTIIAASGALAITLFSLVQSKGLRSVIRLSIGSSPIFMMMLATVFLLLAAGAITLQFQANWFNSWMAQGLFATLVTISALAATSAMFSLRNEAQTADVIAQAGGEIGLGEPLDQISAVNLLVRELRLFAKDERQEVAGAYDRLEHLIGQMDELVDDAVVRSLTEALGPAFQRQGDALSRLDSLEQRLDHLQDIIVKQVERLDQQIED